jgi:predicted PurR-regulated permease PerM
MSEGVTAYRQPHDRGPFVGRTLVVLALTSLFVVVGLLLWNAAEIFLLAFAGVLVAVFLGAPAHFVSSRTPVPHGVALALTVLALIGLGAGVAMLAGPRILDQAVQLFERLPSSLEQVQDTVERMPGGSILVEMVPERGDLPTAGSGLVSRVTGTAAAVWDGLAKLLFVVILGVFLASNPRTYRNGVARLFPKPQQARAREVLGYLARTLRGWVLGQLVAMVMVGTLTAVGLWLIGVPLALVLGLIAGLVEFIPILGPTIAFVPAALLALTVGVDALLWTVGLYVLIQQLEGNVLVPLIQRGAVHLPPALTILAIFVGGALFGVVGLLVATPLMAVIVVLVKVLYLHEALDRRVELPGGTVEG